MFSHGRICRTRTGTVCLEDRNAANYINTRFGDACGNRTRVAGETVRHPDRWMKASFMEERTGFEPASSARQAEMLPFTPTLHVVMLAGFEPTFSG